MQISRQQRRDALRIALQTVAATSATYLVMTWLEWPYTAWAVISAIFTIQLNSDSSLVMAGGRTAGTLLGTGLGLGSVYLLGEGHILLRLAVTTGIMNAVAAIWPALSYGAVVAAALSVYADPEFGPAMYQAGAIIVGSLLGAAATFAVWPDYGRNRALRMLDSALADSRDLLDNALTRVISESQQDRETLHRRLFDDLDRVRAEMRNARLRTRLRSGYSLQDAERMVEYLWHGLVLLDRAVTHQRAALADADIEAISADIDRVKGEACEYLNALIDYLREGRQRPDPGVLKQAVEDAESAAERKLAENGARHDHDRNRAMQVLLFALNEVADNLADLGALVASEKSGSGGAG